jgi:Glycosyl hydrolase family 26
MADRSRARFQHRKRNLTGSLALIATVGLVAQVGVFTSSGATASAAVNNAIPLTPGKTLSGVIGNGGQSAVNSFGAWRGRAVDVVVNYLGTDTWAGITNVAGEGLTKYWDGSNVHRVWTVPMLPLQEPATLEQGATGAYNDKYYKIASDLVAGGDGYSTIRLGWEMTGDWYTWSGVKDPAAYVGTWRQAINTMRSVPGAHFTFDWNVSIGFADPEPMYPGDAYVDLIGADNYDSSWAWSYPPTDHVSVWNHILTEDWGLNWLGTFAKAHGKRLSFPEWGVEWSCDGHGGGDDTYFMQQFHNWMASHDVAYETVNNTDDNSCKKFSMTGGTFPNSAALYKKLEAAGPITSGPTTAPTTTKSASPAPTTTKSASPAPTTTKSASPAPTTTKSAAPTTTASTTSTMDVTRVRASGNSARTGDWALNGTTNADNRYIFLNAPTNTTQVRFYLDRATSSSPTHTESWAPWDFMGETGTAANPFNMGTLSLGSHTLIVLATLSNGTVQSATVKFTVN